MAANLIDAVWIIDKILLYIVLSLSTTIIVYSVFIESFENRRNRALRSIEEKLQKISSPKQLATRRTCPVFIRKFTPRQLVAVEKEDQVLLSKSLKQYVKECFVLSDKTVPIEHTAEKSRNKWRRIEAILCLGCAGSSHALEILKRALLDKDEDIAYFSMLAAGQIKNAESARILLDFLGKGVFSGYKIVSLLETFPASIADEAIKATESGNPSVRFWSIKLILKFKADQHIERIESLAKDEVADVRAAACECLGELGKKVNSGSLFDCLKDEMWFVRMHAVRALSKILGKECVPSVASLIKDSHWLVKESVKNAIAPYIEDALPYLEEYLTGDDYATKKYCIDALIDSGYVAKSLNDILSEDPRLKEEATRLLKKMIRSGVYFGLKKVLEDFPDDSRKKVLDIVKGIDNELAVKIEGA